MLAKYSLTKPQWPLIAIAGWCFAHSIYAQTSDDSKQTVSKQSIPYQAMVIVDDAQVHSGPGSVHYATTQLKTGDLVEVFRHDPGGWCAIRPPEGSFSLVAGTAIKELPDGVGQISQDGTQVWVGTELGPVEKPLWQVKLVKGEKVELLGMAHWPDAAGFSVNWYQVAPPAGEFRWIRQDDIRPPPDATIEAENDYESGTTNRKQANRFDRDLTDSRLELLPIIDADRTGYQLSVVEDEEFHDVHAGQRWSKTESSSSPINSLGWRRARTPILNPDQAEEISSNWNSMVDAAAGKGNSNLYDDSNPPPHRLASADLNPIFGLEQLNAGTGGASTLAWRLSPRLTELELKLSQEMIKAPNLWRLTDLQMVAEHVLESSGDAMEKLQAQRFLEKIANCRQIRDRYLSNPQDAAPYGGGVKSEVGNAQSSMAGIATNQDLSLDTLYDAHGRLNELVREAGKRESTFVLQDEKGKITHHVLPAPGGSLSSYVGKRIGIIGQRGFHTRLNLNHITAQRIVELK